MYKICLVEDEKDLNKLIKNYLEREGYEVISFYNGIDALDYVGNEVNMWILDIMLGDNVSGYDIIAKIREDDKEVPVMFTSARDQDLDKIIGLELDADDYITKPYSPKELVLRINRMIKRVYNTTSEKIEYDNYVVDIDKRIVKQDKEEISLTTLEFDLLILLLNNINKTFKRDEVLNSIWGNDYFGSDRVVDDLIRRLRKKMSDLRINTVYGYGYRLT